MTMIILCVAAAVFVLMLLITCLSWYRKCPSDRILVIFGKIRGQQASLCIHGGAKMVIPILQDYGYISLRPMQINVNLDNALCKQNIRISVPSVFTVGVSTDPALMGNAADRLLGLTPDAIADLAKDIIFGQLRLVIASMMIEEINADRESFLRSVEANVAEELKKLGLVLLNVNITDITDGSGYIEAIGQRAAAGAINQAKIDVAEETRKGSIGSAEASKNESIAVSKANAEAAAGVADAEREQRIAVSQANALAAAGEADAQRDQRIAVSQANAKAAAGEADAQREQRIAVKQADATATQGENLAAIEIARSNAARGEAEAEAYRRAEAAKQIAQAQIEKARFEAEAEAQKSRAGMEAERQRAEVIVPAEIAKQQITIAAEAEAERLRREAQGEADAIYAKLAAEAKGNLEILAAKGEGYRKIIESCNSDAGAASQMLLIEKLQEIVALQTEAIKNIRIDKVTVWDGGSNANGKSSTANFLSGMMGSLPPLHDVAKMAGLELPEYLGKVSDKTPETTAEQGENA
ncbi:MAG: flotillin family protein [Lentisphaeria bacterium]|nr:flotillin family protein [Lentisphaeria bacterium]